MSALVAKLGGSVGAFQAAGWDALVPDTNPFMSHGFLTALEDSGSVGQGTGWQPAPIAIEGENGELVAALPAYLKGHSQGEYVFDHNWADAYQRAGGRYYPKLQIAAPFTPATGPRLLFRDPAYALPLLRAAEQLCAQNGLSGAHATFISAEQIPLFEAAGWLIRHDIQFHWTSRGYRSFDDFLAELSSRKRKEVRKERAAAQGAAKILRLRGAEIRPQHWDAFWQFYQDTGSRKWGSPYLTRSAFDLIAERLGDAVLLVLGLQDAQPIAGALNLIGRDAVYGRYWGCTRNVPFLHFELCYYQAIEVAIELGLGRVEAGAQGGHKLARGYEPARTTSAHWIADPAFRDAIADFLHRERAGVAADVNYLETKTPYRKC